MPYEKHYLHKHGYRVAIMLGIAVLEDTEGDFIGYVLDISDREKAEAELAQYSKKLEQSNKDLEHFATIASHDLQEPLRKVLLFTDHLKKVESSTLSEEAADDLERIQRATGRMQRLITDLLDLSRITRQGKPFQKVELNMVTQKVIDELFYTFQDVRQRVSLNGSLVIEADLGQVYQMLFQLLDNALKFHQPGRPSVVKINIQPANENQCQVTIADDGIGMKTEHISKIFNTFTRLHHDTEYPGTGIGLALTKKIVERHGGSITVDSSPGEGSMFTVIFPISQV